MDTEKHIELQKKLDNGQSPSDEGPYYHHTWWEAYKGGVKGKLGGVVIGGIIGAVVGVAVVGAAALAGLPLAGAALATIGGFSAAGLMYGAHEFGDVGKVTGAVSAGLAQAESRIKTSEGLEFDQIKQELKEIKAIVKGEPANSAEAQNAKQAVAEYDDQDYRKTHYAKLSSPEISSFGFWKVALVGLVAGAIAGFILGEAGVTGEILKHVIGEETIQNSLVGGLLNHTTAASALIFGLMGASFGINRDVFRKIFDKTDLWFKGITHGKGHALVREQQVSSGERLKEELNGIKPEASVATAVIPGSDEPANTQWRDAVLARTQRVLQDIDHNAMTRH